MAVSSVEAARCIAISAPWKRWAALYLLGREPEAEDRLFFVKDLPPAAPPARMLIHVCTKPAARCGNALPSAIISGRTRRRRSAMRR